MVLNRSNLNLKATLVLRVKTYNFYFIGSEKTTEGLPGEAAVTRPEVAGPRCSQRTGCLD